MCTLTVNAQGNGGGAVTRVRGNARNIDCISATAHFCRMLEFVTFEASSWFITEWTNAVSLVPQFNFRGEGSSQASNQYRSGRLGDVRKDPSKNVRISYTTCLCSISSTAISAHETEQSSLGRNPDEIVSVWI